MPSFLSNTRLATGSILKLFTSNTNGPASRTISTGSKPVGRRAITSPSVRCLVDLGIFGGAAEAEGVLFSLFIIPSPNAKKSAAEMQNTKSCFCLRGFGIFQNIFTSLQCALQALASPPKRVRLGRISTGPPLYSRACPKRDFNESQYCCPSKYNCSDVLKTTIVVVRPLERKANQSEDREWKLT